MTIQRAAQMLVKFIYTFVKADTQIMEECRQTTYPAVAPGIHWTENTAES